MEKETYYCRALTPLCSSGADSRQAELRETSIKAMLRFWWRASQANPDAKSLFEQESALFGGTEACVGKSKFFLRVLPEVTASDSQRTLLLPHHEICNGRCSCGEYDCRKAKTMAPGFPSESRFSVEIGAFSRNKDRLELIKPLFELATILGGIGKRSRRGFGSFEVLRIGETPYESFDTKQKIYSLLEKTSPGKFELTNDTIHIRPELDKGGYPYIQAIEIGRGVSDVSSLLLRIGESSHKATLGFGPIRYTGFAGREGRMASSVYVSVVRDGMMFIPVVTTLKAIFAQNIGLPRDNRGAFKEGVL